MTKLSGPLVPPASGEAPRQAVVLLHGYGSDGADLIGLAHYWRDLMPEALFVAPNAPTRCRINPGGYEWFDVDPERPSFRLEGVAGARPVIAEFLSDLWSQTGLTAADTLLVGFSQGAMMALHVALTLDDAVMGVIGFSGALIVPPGLLDQPAARPPICLVHGDEDTVVPVELSEMAAATLRDKGFEVRLHISRGAPHTIAPDGLAFAGAFIADRLATAR
jgi:phospholipase/carboxylesterase